jgi:hypothetical protein
MLYILLSALDIIDRLLALKVLGLLPAADTREPPRVLLFLEPVLPVLPKILSKQVVMTLVGVSRHELVEGWCRPGWGLMERGFF